MKNLIKLVIRLLAITALLAPYSAGQATTDEGGSEGRYALKGQIMELQSKHINIGDVMLRLSPTVKVKKPGKKNASLSDLREGNTVGVKMIQYRGKAYVDTIYYLGAGGASN